MEENFDAMTPGEQFEYMATAQNVTVDTIYQIPEGEKNIKCFYVAKVRGIVVSGDGKCKFDTERDARFFGWGLLLAWKQEYAELEASRSEQLAEDIQAHKDEQLRGLQ